LGSLGSPRVGSNRPAPPKQAPPTAYGFHPKNLPWQRINTEAFECFRNGLLPNAVLALVVTTLPVGIIALPHYAAGLVFASACALDSARGAVLGLCPWLNPMPPLKRLAGQVGKLLMRLGKG